MAQATVSIRGFPRVLFTGLLRPPAMPEDDGGEPSSPDIGGVSFADAADLNIPATMCIREKSGGAVHAGRARACGIDSQSCEQHRDMRIAHGGRAIDACWQGWA